MSNERGLFAELMHRRVPQLVGMYVAATWMLIEIGDWATEQFGLSASLTRLLFVFMVALVPSIVLVAYNHGAPGRDRWTLVEKIFLPINLALAIGALQVFAPTDGPVSATPTTAAPVAPAPPDAPIIAEKTLIDEAGNETVVEVPAIDYFERIAIFPWRNRADGDADGDADTDWLSYGIPMLIEEDIDRSHFVGVTTLFGLQSADELRSGGHPDGRDLPRALQLRIVRERSIGYLVTGTYESTEAGFRLEASLFDVARNQEVSRFETTSTDLLGAIDEIAGRLSEAATPNLPPDQQTAGDLALAEHFTDSVDAARAYVAAARRQYFENDWEGALVEAEKAVSLDPTFAMAFARMGQLQRFSGRAQEALAAVDQALALDYKLGSEERLMLKAERYAIIGETDKALRVLEMLTEVHPNSVAAFQLLGSNYMVLDRNEGALAAFERVRELDPSNDDVVLTLANIHRMQGGFERSEALIGEYLQGRPDDADAVRQLASLYRATGDVDAARATYERAGFLESDDFQSVLALAVLDTWAADFDRAERRFASLEGRNLEPGRAVQVQLAKIQLFQLRGQVTRGLAELDALMPMAAQSMTPIQQIFALGSQKANLRSMRGEHEEALAEIEAAAAQVQPPMDGFFNFARISVHQQLNDADRLREALDQTSRFAEQVRVPFLEPFIQAGLAKLAAMEGRHEEAVRLNREAMAVFRRSVLGVQEPYIADYLNVQLTTSLRKSGDLEEARSTIEEHLRRYPADGEARLEYVRVLREAGDLAGARAELEAVARLWSEADPDFRGLALLEDLDSELADGDA